MVCENIKTDPGAIVRAAFSVYRRLVIGVEYVFWWYWSAGLCTEHNIPFIPGHALYTKAIHGGKTNRTSFGCELRPDKK